MKKIMSLLLSMFLLLSGITPTYASSDFKMMYESESIVIYEIVNTVNYREYLLVENGENSTRISYNVQEGLLKIGDDQIIHVELISKKSNALPPKKTAG